LVRENVAFLSGTASEIRYFATRETPHVEIGRVSRNKITVVFWLCTSEFWSLFRLCFSFWKRWRKSRRFRCKCDSRLGVGDLQEQTHTGGAEDGVEIKIDTKLSQLTQSPQEIKAIQRRAVAIIWFGAWATCGFWMRWRSVLRAMSR
jgi:hypothetical protein